MSLSHCIFIGHQVYLKASYWPHLSNGNLVSISQFAYIAHQLDSTDQHSHFGMSQITPVFLRAVR